MQLKFSLFLVESRNIKQKSNYAEPVAPLARTTSMSSCAGYHTPIEDEVAASELPSDFGRSVSILNAQVPSPMSAVLTVSLDGYLDHQQISYGSPPSSEIAVRRGPSSEESYPVFSPLPTVICSIALKHLQTSTLNTPI